MAAANVDHADRAGRHRGHGRPRRSGVKVDPGRHRGQDTRYAAHSHARAQKEKKEKKGKRKKIFGAQAYVSMALCRGDHRVGDTSGQLAKPQGWGLPGEGLPAALLLPAKCTVISCSHTSTSSSRHTFRRGKQIEADGTAAGCHETCSVWRQQTSTTLIGRVATEGMADHAAPA